MAPKRGSRKGFQMSIRMNSNGREAISLVSQWEKRAAYVAEMMPYRSAETSQHYIRSKILGTSNRPLRESIEISKIKGLSKHQSGYSVHINMKNPLVRKIRPHRVLLTIRAKHGSFRKDPRVAVLEKHSPWTYDSLPFKPNTSKAIVVVKKASAKEVAAVTEKRRREAVIWKRELSQSGFRYRPERQLKVPKNIRTLPDVALEAMQLEFGLGGTRPRPAWRLAGVQFKKTGLANLRRDRHLQESMVKLGSKKWKQGPPRLKNPISVREARDVGNFMKQLGIK